MRAIKETGNLFRLTRFGVINCFLVRESDGFTLVDTGLRGTAESILRTADHLGATIRRIALTHAHVDHIGSLDALVARLPGVELVIGKRETRLLARDFTLDKEETGKKLFGFPGASAHPTRLLAEGDRVGSLMAVASPGHTPGHLAYLDVRDNSLLAGDSFTTQTGLVVAGVFKPVFPFPALFSWNASVCAMSATKLRGLNPALLAVGHGRTLFSPAREMDLALAEAYRQHPEAKRT
jgi:glyoxylase-like metal-dependent hydrolase (beta-lactamase superfamily II)